MIVPWGVGGGGDRVGRIFAGLMSAKLGVSVPVINVTGASSQVGLNKVLGEPADGYNVIEITSDSYILFAAANAKFKVSDFTALAVVDRSRAASSCGKTVRFRPGPTSCRRRNRTP